MATVVDSLVVELGIDPKNFTRGQQQAIESLRNLEEQSRRSALNIEGSSQRAASALGGIRTQTLELYGAIGGGAALVAFATNAIHAGAAAGRLSRNIGVSVDTITRFQGLASTFGGSAEGMAQSFVAMSDALEGWKIGDVKQVIADYRALGAAGGTVIDINKGVEQTFLDLAKNLKEIHDTQGAGMAGYWQRRLGLDPGLFDAMIQKGGNFNELLQKMRGLTDEEAEAAGRLERRWNTFVNNATKAGQGMILDLVDSKSKFNPLNNGSDEKDLKMIGGWIDSAFGTHLVSEAKAAAAPVATGTGTGAFTSDAEKEAFIRSESVKRNLDPDVMVKVAKSEGFDKFLGDNGTSGGAFQLHVTPGGRGRAVGDEFQKQTGLDPLDRNNERAGISFALDDIRAHGLGAYHGAARVGLGNNAGGAGAGGTSTTTVSITGPISINAGPNADGRQIGEKFVSTVKRQSFAAQANGGQD